MGKLWLFWPRLEDGLGLAPLSQPPIEVFTITVLCVPTTAAISVLLTLVKL